MPKGPWYVSARAVREYAALARLGDPDDERVWATAEDELIDLCEETVGSGRKVLRLRSGLLQYRGPRPLRLTLIVSEDARPEGTLPQLISVLPQSTARSR